MTDDFELQCPAPARSDQAFDILMHTCGGVQSSQQPPHRDHASQRMIQRPAQPNTVVNMFVHLFLG